MRQVYESDIKSIVGCTTCECSGVIEKHTGTDYHRREDFYTTMLCPKCGGAGRLELNTHSVRVEVKMPSGKSDYATMTEKTTSKLTQTTEEFYADRIGVER